MKKTLLLLILFILAPTHVFSQNLMEEQIRRISPRKRSVYLNSGVFHNGGPKIQSSLRAVRQNYSKSKNYERLVFDFKTKELPRIYGYISKERRKLFIDLFETSMEKDLSSFGNSKYVKSINFFPIQADTLSVEIIFKDDVSLDVFYLQSPGRLVIDLKK
jgi:hypothetical protein